MSRLGPPDVSRFPLLTDDYVRTLHSGLLVGRIFFAGGDHPTSWNTFRTYGPTSSRFDHHPPPPKDHPVRGILYAAPLVTDVDGEIVSPLDTALAEVFGPVGVVDTKLAEPHFVGFRLSRDVTSLDLVDSNWVTVAGATASLFSGPRTGTRDWARAIYRHYTNPLDGLFYGSSNMPRGRSIAFFERARDALSHADVLLPLSAAGLRADLEAACSRLGFGLL